MPVTADHKSLPLLSAKATFKDDPELYKQWIPKIQAYRKARDDALNKDFFAPDSMLPEDLDEGDFNATLVVSKVLDAETLAIVSLSAYEIASKIKEGELTAVKTLEAFIKSATLAHQLTNCAMEILFTEGLARAQELDEYQKTHGTTVGALHGVPLSLKEHYDYPGHITHRGFVALLDNVPDRMATTPQILYDLGAVFYIRTTEPQSLMHPDSWNNITGRGRNAVKTSLSPGGSSSGEGALIAMKGSPFGLGSDIGGSVRFPAAFNGIWALKPSTKRISMVGCSGAADGFYSDGVLCVLGPMARDPLDLELFMESYLSTSPWEKDQQLIPLPWRKQEPTVPEKTTIAIYLDDGVVKPHPPNVRALKEATTKLKDAGFNVVIWDAHRVYEAMEVIGGLFNADGNANAYEKLKRSGEPLFPLTDIYLQVGRGEAGLSALEVMDYSNVRETLRQEYLQLMNERKVDFILGPTYVGVAPKPSKTQYWSYTSLWNLLDSSCVTFPSGTYADKDLDPRDSEYVPRNDSEKYEYGMYVAEESDGMPVGLTLTGRRYTEEATLEASKAIFKALHQ